MDITNTLQILNLSSSVDTQFTFVERYSKIDQHLVRHCKYNGAGLSSPPPFLCSKKMSLFQFNGLRQSGTRVVILANCGLHRWNHRTF